MNHLMSADWHSDRHGWGGSVEELRGIMDDCEEIMLARQIKSFVHLGDLFHRPNPSSFFHAMMIQRFQSWGKKGIEVLITEGNHEYNQSGSSALDPVRSACDNVFVVTCRNESFLFGKFVCIPHFGKDRSKEESILKLGAALKEAKKLKIRPTIIGHVHYAGAEVGSEEYMLGGGATFLDTLALGPDVMPVAFFGHIHKPQEIGKKGRQVVYLGSPKCIDMGERNEKKRVIVYDDETGGWEGLMTHHIPWVEMNIPAKDLDAVPWEEAEGAVVKFNVLDAETIGVDTAKIRENLAGAKHVLSINVYRDKVVAVRDEKMTATLSPQEALKVYVDRLESLKEWKPEARRKKLYDMGTKVLEGVCASRG